MCRRTVHVLAGRARQTADDLSPRAGPASGGRPSHAQDAGADTVDANSDLGLPVDARDYTHAAQVLRELGVTRLQLLSNNPAKVEALGALGIEVAGRTPLPAGITDDNLRYLRTKRDRMGHSLPDLPAVDQAGGTLTEGDPT